MEKEKKETVMPTPANFTENKWVENWKAYSKLFADMQKREFWD